MGEMVASRSMQMLLHLADKYKYASGLVEDEVNELVLLLGKIEKLLIKDGNSRKVTENIRKIRNLVYTIEDALETLAVKVEEVEFMPSKNEKKRGITRLLRRHFRRGDEGSRIILVMFMFVVKSILEGQPLIKWLHDTFPEVFESEGSAVLDRSLAHRKSLQWPRLMYTHDMEDHFVEMKDDLEKLVELVADQDKQHRVVSIYGVKGLGKTNLARRVYIDPKVRSHFNAFAWVSLNQDYQIDDLLQNILNQLDAGALKKSAEEKMKVSEEKKGNILHGMKKLEAVNKSAEEKEKGVEKKIEGAQEREKGVEKKKEGVEEKGSLFTSIMRIGAGKKSALEHKKGAEEKNEGVDETKEGAHEQEKGVEETKEGTEEKGSLFKNIMRIGAGKDSAAEHKKGAEEKKEGVDETKEGAQEQEKGVDEKKEGAEEKGSLFTNIMRIGAGKKSAVENKKVAEEKKEGVDETKEGAQEQEKGVLEEKEGAEDKGSLFTNIKRIGAGKKGVADHKKGAEKKKEGAQEQQKVVEEKKEGGEEKGSLFTNIMRIGAGKKSAAEHKKGAEEKKEGVDEKKEGAEEKKEGVVKHEKGAEEKKEGVEEKGSLSTNIMRIGAGKKSAAEHKKGAEEKKEGVDETKEGAEEQSKSSEETVMDKLKKILSNQRCFIVIDDVSESSPWDYISSEFLMEGAVTRFLLTTENEEIAGVGLSHKLRCLNDDEGWELLQKYAFRGKKVPDLGLMPKLGKEMVQQCGGLPSKISRLGRTLSKMSSLSEWHKVNDDVARYLERAAHQSESNNRLYDDPISYDGLPYGEKQCFLYLAMFKQDEGVDPEDLSFLWMAEGIVSTDQKLERNTIMDTTEYYLKELASMLHVQVDELSTNRRFMPLSLRNDLREWSLHLGEREDFRLKVVDFSGGKQPRFDQYTLSDGTRRLVIHFNKLSSPVERDLNATEDLRSLLFLNSDQEYVNLPVKISDFSEFLLLRVLHFVRCKFEGRELPKGIWKLLNLRYFGVLYCDLDKLPPSITNFRNLQVLNVRSYDDSKMVIPNVISQMKTLKHVRLPSNSDHEQRGVKLKLDGLLDLETLDGFNDDIHDLDSLSKLEKLQHLSTRADSNASLESIIKFVKSHGARIRTNLVIEHSCDLTSPEAMTVLEEVLMCPNLNALTFSMVVLPMFPNCGKFASKQLTQIKLIGCKLREDPMEALGKFPDLRKLCLGYGAFIGTKIDIRDGGFPSLEYLEFRCLPNLEEWNVDEGAMKKLSTLIVRKCPKLKGIPYALESHKTLNQVEIELPPTALCDGCLKIYNRKLKFVKSLNIRKLDPLHSSGAH